MTRCCDGTDPNLVMIVDKLTGERVAKPAENTEEKPCDCGSVFDDVRREVYWPHPLV